jgi:hypothetical protein
MFNAAGRHREASMQSRLGSANLALLSLYFAPVWGIAAVRALTSPYHGLEDGAHAAAAIFFRRLFDLGDGGLILTSHILAGVKLVIAVGFVAYAIEFARALATGRDADPETTDVTLTLAVIGLVVWAVPALALGEGAPIRLHATQMLMVTGAIFVIIVERHMQRVPEASRVKTAEREQAAARLVLPIGMLMAGPAPGQTEAALARIPESRFRRPGS